jgi:acyl carrier protein
MSDDSIRATLLAILGGIAPEVDLGTLRPDADLRDELDIDSMDFLRFVVGIQERLGVAVPESDYPRVRTLAGCTAYVAEALRGRGAGTSHPAP